MIGYAIEGYSRECPPWDSVRKLYIKLSIKLLGKNANTKGLRSKALHQALCREALHEAVRKVPRRGGSMESL